MFENMTREELLTALQAKEEELAKFTAEAENDTWWQTIIGCSHKPTGEVSIKHLHPLTVKPIYEAHKGTVVGDIIAGLLFEAAITRNREKFLRDDKVATLQSALAEARGANAWQPMETAPKDGTVIDVWRPEGGRETVFWGYPHHECGEMGQYCDSDWHSIRAPGWVCNTFGEFLGRKHAPFTHWRAIPAGPLSPGEAA